MLVLKSIDELIANDARYRTAIRSAVRGLWRGILSYSQTYNNFDLAIKSGLTRAFHLGLQDSGIEPSEMSSREVRALDQMITASLTRITGFLDTIEENSRANEGKLGPLLSRADVWINRFDEARNRARILAGEDKKLKWVMDPSKEHCVDCLKLDGKVKRASQWEEYGIAPRTQVLACGGWRCGCDLVPTDDPMSMGPLPMVTGATVNVGAFTL